MERGDSAVVGRHGYWLIRQDGAGYAYGTASYDGGANTLPGGPGTPIAAAADPTGGYWLIGQDGLP